MRTGVLVVAKAPVPGLAKTRVAAAVGDRLAAEIASAALLDTMDAVESWVGPADRLLAITGDLSTAAGGAEISARLRHWSVVRQRGDSFGARLVCAHHAAAALWGTGTAVVQIGTDTPALSPFDLEELAAGLRRGDRGSRRVALGPAADGGWWGLATPDPEYVHPLVDVAMSRPDTAISTVRAFAAHGVHTELVHTLTDVDTVHDALAAAELAPASRLARIVRSPAVESPA